MTTTSNWQVDDIDDALAADFDGSLSGLGMELGTSSFNMNDALLALPNLTVLKTEVCPRDNGSRSHHDSLKFLQGFFDNYTTWSDSTAQFSGDNSQSGDNSDRSNDRPVNIIHGRKNRLTQCIDEDATSTIKRFCVSSEREEPSGGSSFSVPDLRVSNTQYNSPSINSSVITHVLQHSPTSSIHEFPLIPKDSAYQFVLGAATSTATKISEETMTYLNQGQSYEIKLKKLGNLTELRGKTMKSVIRVGFQERRLQYAEKEQVIQWSQQHPGVRIIELDLPLSYGISNSSQDVQNINIAEFNWDPTKEVGVFFRVNCISTEFTLKKHGGEKGVPFRIQIETYNPEEERPYVASCQVKVFKPKGADRRHKTDREKMHKRTPSEQDKYHPPYHCTVLRECTGDILYQPSTSPTSTAASTISVITPTTSPLGSIVDLRCVCIITEQNSPPTASISLKEEQAEPIPLPDVPKPLVIKRKSSDTPAIKMISSEASATEATLWLQQNRFSNHLQSLTNFSGEDLLRLSREDLIQICGLADGIRLYNALQFRTLRARLTLYIHLLQTEPNQTQTFRALYLENLTIAELSSKLANSLGLMSGPLNIFLQGPSGIHVVVTDEVILNLADEAMFIVEASNDADTLIVLLKPFSPISIHIS